MIPSMTDEELDAYAGRLGDGALAVTGDPIIAVSVLMQAAMAVMVAKGPGAASVEALEYIAKDTIAGFRELLQPEGTKQ